MPSDNDTAALLQRNLECTRAELRIAYETIERERADRQSWQWVATCVNRELLQARRDLHETREQLAVYTDLDSLP